MSVEQSPLEPSDLKIKVLRLKLVGTSLLLGLTLVTGLLIYVVQTVLNGPMIDLGFGFPLLSTIAVAVWLLMTFGLGLLLSKITLPGLLQKLVNNPNTLTDEELSAKLMDIWSGQQFLQFALKEGPAIFGAIVYVLEQQAFVLVVPALSIVLLALTLPTEAGTRLWLDAQTRRIRELQDERERSEMP